MDQNRRGRNSILKQVLAGLEGVAIMLACYLTLFLKPIRDRWGTTLQKHQSEFPVDHLISDPLNVFTHAILIKSPASAVWPWIAQIGQGRGGFYSYELLENLTGMNIINAWEILEEFQYPKEGDLIPFGAGTAYPIVYLQLARSLAIGVWYDMSKKQTYDPVQDQPRRFLEITWLWHLESISETSCRLYSRNRMKLNPSLGSKLLTLLGEPIVFAMDRKMLHGIKRRAERSQSSE